METVILSITDSDLYKIKEKKLIISVAAGIRIEKYESLFYKKLNENEIRNLPVIRVMPNTPGLVLEGMSGFCKNSHTTKDDTLKAIGILESMGDVMEVEESMMDAVTAVSGSGPAYFFYFIEALSEAGVKAGLSSEDALHLSIATIKGAAKLLDLSEDSPATLRKNVTSPGGTTEAALAVMAAGNVKETIIKAVLRAAERSKELSG
jgi:pyrroline-5-carboxylate reductase